MNDFEYNYTAEKQQQSREYYAEKCAERAASNLASAERNEKLGDYAYASTCRALATFNAKRKKEWLSGEYFETLGKTLRFFLPTPANITEDTILIEAIIDTLLENLHSEEVYGSRSLIENDFVYLREYSRGYTRTWKGFSKRMKEDYSGIVKFLQRRKEKRGLTPDMDAVVYDATKNAWYQVLGAWYNYKQWQSEKEV